MGFKLSKSFIEAYLSEEMQIDFILGKKNNTSTLIFKKVASKIEKGKFANLIISLTIQISTYPIFEKDDIDWDS